MFLLGHNPTFFPFEVNTAIGLGGQWDVKEVGLEGFYLLHFA